MATKTTLRIEGKDTGGNSASYNITYINPQTSDVTLKEFAQKVTALTNNTLVSIQRTDTTDITTATYPYNITISGDDEVEVDEGSTATGELDSNIPSSEEVTWEITPGGSVTDFTVNVTRLGSTSSFQVSIKAGTTLGTGTVTLTPKISGNAVASSVTYTVTVNPS